MASPKVRRVINVLEADLGRVVQKLALDAEANLKESTPVDTGWARANWVPSIGRPYRARSEKPGTNPELGAQTRRAKQAAGEIAVLSYQPYERVFVSNNVPYVPILDESHPEAAGFVERAIDKAVAQSQAKPGAGSP